MTLTELRYLLALAEEQHFGRAALRCHVSQPSLSMAIKKLEQSLGVALFERYHNDIKVTAVGEEIIIRGQRILYEVEGIHELVKSLGSQLEHPLKIGGIHTVAPYLFPRLIPALKQYAPKMSLVIRDHFTSELRTKLKQGELDVAFIALPFQEHSIVVKPLYEESFVILLPKNHPLATRETLTQADLSSEKILLLGEGHCLRDQILEACPLCFQPGQLQESIEGVSLETLRCMVASGLGITILPESAVTLSGLSDLLCIRSFKETPAAKRTIAMAWRAGFTRTQAVDVLLNALKDICKVPNAKIKLGTNVVQK